MPAASATSAAADFIRSPSATRWLDLGDQVSRSGVSATGRRRTSTTVISPRTPSTAHSASSARAPRDDLFVRLGQLAAHGGAAVRAQHLARRPRACRRAGGATRRTRRCVARWLSGANQASRSPDLRGGKPSNAEPVARQPGHGQRRRHRGRAGQAGDGQVLARRTPPPAGSRDRTRSAFRRPSPAAPSPRSRSDSTRPGSLLTLDLVVEADTRPDGLTCSAAARLCNRRVSSAAITSAVSSASTRRGEASRTSPSGVAARTRRPEPDTGLTQLHPTIGTVTVLVQPGVARRLSSRSRPHGSCRGARPAAVRRPDARLAHHAVVTLIGGRRPVLEPRVSDRQGHADLRREALRAAGGAGAAQRRLRGQPRLRADRAPAARASS